MLSSMAKAVFIQNPESPYDDQPGEAYHFPHRYLGMVKETVGDWVVFYEGRKGAFGYVAIQRVLDVVADLKRPGHYYANMDRGSLWEFETRVPRAGPDGVAFEKSLRGPDNRPSSGGANAAAVRRLSEGEFAKIVRHGLQPEHGPDSYPREGPLPSEEDVGHFGFAEDQELFPSLPETPIRPEVLTLRKYRDPAFSRMVKRAYGGVCAISGLSLHNGGGRPEVQAAHIRPVKDGGPDTISNGIALSGTLHWMFDRGLISVASDLSILVSHNKVPEETARRLIAPGKKLLLPQNPRHHPHPEYLRYHRETYFGRLD